MRQETQAQGSGRPDDGLHQLVLVDDADGLATLAEDWRALEKAQAQPVFFQSHAWCAHLAETQQPGGRIANSSAYVPIVAMARRAGEIVAVWPLCIKRHGGMRVLRNLDDPFGQFAGLLARDQMAADAVVRLAISHVRLHRLAGAAQIERVIVGSPLHHALAAAGATAGARITAPFVSFAGVGTAADFKASRNRKSMKNMRNALNRLGRAGKLGHVMVREDTAVCDLIRRALANRETWLRDAGRSSPAFRHPQHEAILTGGAVWGLDGNRIGFELLLSGRPIAQLWGFLHEDTFYAYMSGTAADMRELSPGRAQLALVMDACIEAGFCGVELLTPASPYKLMWTDQVRELVDMRMELSALGRLNAAIWARGVRPVLKSIYYGLPTPVRRRLPL